MKYVILYSSHMKTWEKAFIYTIDKLYISQMKI